MNKALVCVPTYNERDNLGPITAAILDAARGSQSASAGGSALGLTAISMEGVEDLAAVVIDRAAVNEFPLALVTLLVVLAFVGWRALFRPDIENEPEPIDWQESVSLAEEAGLRVVRPEQLPEGWIATTVDLRAGDIPRWGLGVLTDEGDYIGIRQEDSSIEELVRTYIDKDYVDGEPVQGSLAEFVAHEAELLRPARLVLCHHDDWLPGFSVATDLAPIRAELGRRAPATELVELGYLDGTKILP